MIKRLSFALRLSDIFLKRPLLSSEAEIYVDGLLVRHEYKQGGYFVVSDLSEGRHHVTVGSFKLQSEELDITVDYSPDITAQQRTYCLMLNPSGNHPEAIRLPSVRCRIKNERCVYILRERAELKIAEDTATAGNTRLKLFGAKPELPSLFRIIENNAGNRELVTISGFDGESYILAEPLKYSHARSVAVVPLVRVSCDENGEFFFVIPPEFEADKESGKINLNMICIRENNVRTVEITVSSKGITDLGELKMKKESGKLWDPPR